MTSIRCTRRSILGLGLALCGSGLVQAAPRVQVGYMPIMADVQTFVIMGGLVHPNPLQDAKLITFQSGPEITQALLSRQLDVAYVGVGPAMVARAGGADVRFVAANTLSTTELLVLGKLAEYFAAGDDAREALTRFTQEQGRRPRLTTFPIGSGPAAALRHWVIDTLGLELSAVDIVYQGENQLVQALLTGAVDGAGALHPAIDIVQSRRPDARVVVPDLFPVSGGAGVLVRARLVQEQPDYVRQLVAAQIEATRLLREDPDTAAPAVAKVLGGGRLAPDIVRRAMDGTPYEVDPRVMREGTERLYAFQKKMGVFKKELVVAELFDASFYEELTA